MPLQRDNVHNAHGMHGTPLMGQQPGSTQRHSIRVAHMTTRVKHTCYLAYKFT